MAGNFLGLPAMHMLCERLRPHRHPCILSPRPRNQTDGVQPATPNKPRVIDTDLQSAALLRLLAALPW